MTATPPENAASSTCTCGRFDCRAGRRLCNDEPVRPFNVLVSEIVTYEVTVDPSQPAWDWLNRYDRQEWPRLIRTSANETGGTLSEACTYETATGAWREVNLP